MISIKSNDEIGIMREAGRIVTRVFENIEGFVGPGIATEELEKRAKDLICKAGAVPAFKGYRGFPGNICVSLNEEVVHGIPGKRRLKKGDIVSIDIGVKFKGYYADMAKSFGVGRISDGARRLLEVTKKALDTGIEEVTEGGHLSNVSDAIQRFVELNGFSVVRALVGHGIGVRMHEPPEIPNFGKPNRGPRLKAGMVLAIEPMVNSGRFEVECLRDGWTMVTKDRRLSAHFEHTVLVTKNDPEILTL